MLTSTGVPGILLYAATAAVLLVLAHRAVRRLGRPAALVLVALPLLFTGDALVRGDAYGPYDLFWQFDPWTAHKAEYGIGESHEPLLSDLSCQITPWWYALRRSVGASAAPLRNPHLLAGDLLAASAQAAPFSPVQVASLVLPPAQATSYRASVVFLVAGLAAFLLARELGCREGAALVAALAWAASDVVAFWVGWPLGAAIAWLPAVWLATERLVTRPGLPSGALLTAVLAAIVVSGHPESTLHLVQLGSIWAVARLPWADLRHTGRAVGVGLAAGAVTLLLTAACLLPILEALPQTSELAARRAAFAAMDRSLPFDEAGLELSRLVAPFLHGVAGDVRARTTRQFVEPAAGAVGSIAFGFAVFGLVASGSRSRWLLLGFVVFGALAGAGTPGVADLLGLLPLTDMAINERLWCAAAAALAILAALGAEAWLAGGRSRAAAATLALSTLAVGALAWALLPFARAGELPEEFLVRRLAWLVVPPLAVAVAVLAGRARLRASALAAGALLLVPVAVQRHVDMGGLYPRIAARAFYPVVPPLDRLLALQAAEAPFRVVGLHGALQPNIAAVYGLEDVRGYQAMHLRQFVETYRYWCERLPAWFNVVRDLERPFLSFLNVRYAIAPPGTPAPIRWVHVGSYPGGELFENPRVVPRVAVPREVRIGGAPRQVERELEAERDFRQRAWISGPGMRATGRPRAVRNRGSVERLVRRTGGYDLEVQAPAPAWIVVSEAAWNGWQATLATGERLPRAYANHGFLAFKVPAGRHAVRVEYRPWSWRVGSTVSLATLAALGVVIAVGLARRRRQRTGAGDATEDAV